MKNLVLILLLVIGAKHVQGQEEEGFIITFDSGTNQQVFYYAHSAFDSFSFNYATWLYNDTVNCPNNKWQIGKPDKTVFNAAYSALHVIVTDTLHPVSPNDTSVFYINVPKWFTMDLESMSFYYKLDVDSGDLAQMDWSGDTGRHWHNILTDTNQLFTFYSGVPDFSISTTGWANLLLYPVYPNWETLSSLPYYTIRFTFISGSSTLPRDGWMIDNFNAMYPVEAVPDVVKNKSTNIFPNPVSNTLSLSANTPIGTISITNALGQVVFQQNTHDERVAIDVSTFPKGVYYLKVGRSGVKAFLKD